MKIAMIRIQVKMMPINRKERVEATVKIFRRN